MSIITKNNMVRLYTATLISLLDDIEIQRETGSLYTVPITMATRDRFNDASNKKSSQVKYSQSLPAMSIAIEDLEFNFDRQTNKLLRKRYLNVDDENVLVTWNDVSVNVDYSITLKSKSKTEMFYLLEHIMSSFKNGLMYVNVKSPLYDKSISTPIRLNTTRPEIDNHADEYDNNRTVEATLDFTIEGVLHNNISLDNNGNTLESTLISKIRLIQCHVENEITKTVDGLINVQKIDI